MQTFKTKKECREYLDKLVQAGLLVDSGNGLWYERGTFVLQHGEYDRPDYKPVRYKGGWGIKAIYHYYCGSYRASQDGRVNIYDAGGRLEVMTEEDYNMA